MSREHLLDAIGLLDDDLIQEAETAQKRRSGYRGWTSLAACLAVVLVLGYGLTHIRLGSKNTAAPSGGSPATSNEASNGSGAPGVSPMPPAGSNASGNSFPEPGDADSSAGFEVPPSAEGPAEHDFCAAIMVDGLLYWSTDTPVPGEPDPSIIQTVTSYTDTQPEEDGQTNFDRGLTTRYAMTDLGLVVLIDHEWVLFDPIPPWER